MMLIAVVVMALFAGIAQQTSSSISRADKEAELIFRGQEYMKAIAGYYKAGRLHKSYPPSLEALVKDPRFPQKHHIRRLYSDPINNSSEWTLIQSPDGGIMGVASQSELVPLRKNRFPKSLEKFNEAETYRDWKFIWQPQKTDIQKKASS